MEGKRFTRPKCAADYPDYKIQWGRFPLTADWLRECNGCTDGVMLTDTRDVYFQADPFKDAEPHGLAVFEEHPDTSADHWLTDLPVSRCRDYKFTKAQKMLCSGSTMGSREGVLDYVKVMVAEFDHWKKNVECRSDMKGDDQSIAITI